MVIHVFCSDILICWLNSSCSNHTHFWYQTPPPAVTLHVTWCRSIVTTYHTLAGRTPPSAVSSTSTVSREDASSARGGSRHSQSQSRTSEKGVMTADVHVNWMVLLWQVSIFLLVLLRSSLLLLDFSPCCCSLRALLLLDQYRQKSRLFRSPVLLVPLGDDFRYVESREWDAQFNNYQRLFDYFEQHPELHIKVRPWWTTWHRWTNTFVSSSS